MSNLVAFETQPIPEFSPDNISAISEGLEMILTLDLPGIVIRQAGVDIDEAESVVLNCAPENTQFRSGPTFTLKSHKPALIGRERRQRRNQDLGFHVDSKNCKSTEIPLNCNWLEAGQVAVGLALLGPDLKIWRSEDSNTFHNEDTKRNYRNGLVDPNMFVPNVHTSLLNAGDMVVFSDANVGHDFTTQRSKAKVRTSKSRLFYVSHTS